MSKTQKTFATKIIEENSCNLTKEILIKVHKVYRIPNILDQKINSPWHIIIKTLDVQNTGKILKAAKEKDQVTYKGRHL